MPEKATLVGFLPFMQMLTAWKPCRQERHQSYQVRRIAYQCVYRKDEGHRRQAAYSGKEKPPAGLNDTPALPNPKYFERAHERLTDHPFVEAPSSASVRR